MDWKPGLEDCRAVAIRRVQVLQVWLWLGVLLLALPLGAQGSGALIALPDVLPQHYGVIGVLVVQAGSDTVRVHHITPYGPAERAGLRPGDRILGVEPFRTATPAQFSRCIESHPPGTSVRLRLLRDGRPLTVDCAVVDRRQLYFLMADEARTAPAAPRRDGGEGTHAFEEALEAVLRDGGGMKILQGLRRVLADEAASYGADGRRADLDHLLLNPLKGVQFAEELAAALAQHQHVGGVLEKVVEGLDLVPSDLGQGVIEDPEEGGADGSIERLLIAPFQQAVDLARRSLTDRQRAYLFEAVPLLLERFGSTFYLDRGPRVETERHLATLRLAKRLDRFALAAAARHLTRLTRAEDLARLRRAAAELDRAVDPLPAAFAGRFLYARQLEWGWVLIGDSGPNFYGATAALVVDLGGDDIYFNNAGGAGRTNPVGLLIDYSGNDRYLGRGPGAVGGAIGGVGVLVDLEGDDIYQGSHLVQGAAFGGVGLLWDHRGDDIYLADEVAQGAAFFGAGLLVDEAGADLYGAGQFAQAFGGSGGTGLVLDRSGDDRYLADLQRSSVYGKAGEFDGWAQGVGCGFRWYAPGGMGLLLDLEGSDQYQGGNFSQGTGYFFGLGLLVDRTGADHYRGRRYSQGVGVHQAVGVLLEGGGADRYQAKWAAHQGSGWDAGVGLLVDWGGDDSYRGGELAQGAGSMNGIGVLLDWSGADRYRAHSGQGLGGSTDYWGGRGAANLGLLLDGAGRDQYDRPERRDGGVDNSAAGGFFRDH